MAHAAANGSTSNYLPIEASVVTEEFLKETLKCAQKRDDIFITDFSVSSATSKGENFASIVLRVRVMSKEGNEEKMHHLIVKTLPDSEYLRKLVLSMKIVEREIMAYKELCPAFIQYQVDKGLEPVCPSIPAFYYGITNDVQGIVVLEDLCEEGYKLADRLKGFDYEHCKLVMKELAKFHALSYAMKDGNLENLKEKFGLACMEPVYSAENRPVFEPMFQNGIKTAVDMVTAMGVDEKTKEHLKKLQNLEVFNVMQDILKPEEPFSLICHGDAWCNNMMFNYGNGENNAPTDVKLLDLQVLRYSLPTTDLALFFFTGTTSSLRKTHLSDLLQLYHKSFIDTLNFVNVKVAGFTFEMLETMFKKNMMAGVVLACCFLPGILGKPADVPDTKEHLAEEEFHKTIIDVTKNVLTGSRKILVHERIVGAIQDAVDAGML